MNTTFSLRVTRMQQSKRFRFNPLTSLSGPVLTRILDGFDAGYLREAACVWDALEQRDDLLRTVISKRKKSAARHGWTVLPKANLTAAQKAQAKEHARALEFFYGNLQCEHAVDSAEKGGFKLLARQMMDAVGKRFAVHEILWEKASAAGDTGGTDRHFVTAKFRFVPLGFFENTTGRLRFLENESAVEGRELEPGAWMVSTGDGLMMASATAWMFKHLSLDDWLRCSQKHGTPGLRGISAAARGSDEWNALERSLASVLEGNPTIHGPNEDVQVIDLLPRGTMPFPQLVERIDRLLAALWRGADLSTLSRDRGYGASLQEKETCSLEEDDAEMLSETLNCYVDEWVIRHVFGPDVKPLAYVKVLVSPRECTTADIQIDEFLIRNGAPLSIQETMSRYGRAVPKSDEPIFPSAPAESQCGQLADASTRAANYPESSQGLEMGTMGAMENHTRWNGPAVSFRDGSPAGCAAEGEGQPTREGALSLENQFTLLQTDWFQLSPYGDFPHARGLQRVDRGAAVNLVEQFNSFRGRLGRLFGGVPFYVGHPDLANSSELADRKAYGWVMQLEAREDGLYGEVKWSEAGLDLLKNAHFKFLSPYWEAREIGTEKGRKVYQPVALVSVGLTNQPNIPVKPLANEVMERPDVPDELERKIRESEPLPGGDRQLSKHTPDLILSRPEHINSSPNAPDGSLGMHTVSLTNQLGMRRGELLRMHNRRDRIQEAVLAKVRLGLTYDAAWESVKREHATWFEQ